MRAGSRLAPRTETGHRVTPNRRTAHGARIAIRTEPWSNTPLATVPNEPHTAETRQTPSVRPNRGAGDDRGRASCAGPWLGPVPGALFEPGELYAGSRRVEG